MICNIPGVRVRVGVGIGVEVRVDALYLLAGCNLVACNKTPWGVFIQVPKVHKSVMAASIYIAVDEKMIAAPLRIEAHFHSVVTANSSTRQELSFTVNVHR